MQRFRVRMQALLLAATALVVGACASPGVPAEVRARYGAVGLETAVHDPALHLDEPPTSAATGALYGVASSGALAVATTARSPDVVAVPLGVVMGVISLPFTVGAGVLLTADEDEVAAARPVFERELAARPLGQDLERRFAAHAAAYLGRPLVPADRADTVVAVTLMAVRFGGTTRGFTPNSPFGLVVRGHVRVTRRADGALLWERENDAAAPDPETHTFVGWTEDGGARLRAALDGAIDALARDLASRVMRGEGP